MKLIPFDGVNKIVCDTKKIVLQRKMEEKGEKITHVWRFGGHWKFNLKIQIIDIKISFINMCGIYYYLIDAIWFGIAKQGQLNSPHAPFQ